MQSFSRNRSYFVGLIAGFSLVAMFLCASSFLLVQPDINFLRGTSWTPPVAELQTPTLVTSGGNVGLQIGQRARVAAAAVNLRQTPGYLDKPVGDVIGSVRRGEIVEIINGPQIVDNLTWWQIKQGKRSGWMAESRATGERLLEPVS